VFGLPERLAQLGWWVSMWSSNVRVVRNHSFDAGGAERLRLLGIEVVRDEVTGLVHEDDRLVALSTESGAEIPCDAAWIANRLKPASDLATSLCDVDDAGFPKTDEHGRTGRLGSFCHRKRQQPHCAPGSRGSRRNGGRTLGNDALVGVVVIGQTRGIKARPRKVNGPSGEQPTNRTLDRH